MRHLATSIFCLSFVSGVTLGALSPALASENCSTGLLIKPQLSAQVDGLYEWFGKVKDPILAIAPHLWLHPTLDTDFWATRTVISIAAYTDKAVTTPSEPDLFPVAQFRENTLKLAHVGGRNQYTLTYQPKAKQLSFHSLFPFEGQESIPRSIRLEGLPGLSPNGSLPTTVFEGLYAMASLGIPNGSLQTAVLSNIVNEQALAGVWFGILRWFKMHPGRAIAEPDIAAIVADLSFVRLIATILTQSGHQVAGVETTLPAQAANDWFKVHGNHLDDFLSAARTRLDGPPTLAGNPAAEFPDAAEVPRAFHTFSVTFDLERP